VADRVHCPVEIPKGSPSDGQRIHVRAEGWSFRGDDRAEIESSGERCRQRTSPA